MKEKKQVISARMCQYFLKMKYVLKVFLVFEFDLLGLVLCNGYDREACSLFILTLIGLR